MKVRHPAKFTGSILERIAVLFESETDLLEREKPWIMDPFAGTGKGVEFFADRWPNVISHGLELEPEWAHQSRRVVVGDVLDLPQIFSVTKFDAIITSPAYGNRMADHHEAKDDSRRNTYRHALGRPLSDGSSAGLQWGREYREFHNRAWAACVQVLGPGAWFCVNVKNHIRKGKIQRVVEFHIDSISNLLGGPVALEWVPVKGNRQGENSEARVDAEVIALWRAP